jgi:ABC-2 type transport system permease protein
MTNLLAAELLKLRTTRTAWGLLVAAVGLSALAVASAVAVGAGTSLDLESARGARTILSVSASGALFVLVLGVIVSAGEFRQGTATGTFLTTPRRWRVILAKLVAGAASGAVFGSAAAGVSIGVADLAYRLKGLSFPFESSGAWATLAGAVLYATLFGAIGAATGSLGRNQVLGIVGWLVWFAVVEHVTVGLFPTIGRWLPFAAGSALVRPPNSEVLLSPPTAALVLFLYAVAIASLAVFGERYRDA